MKLGGESDLILESVLILVVFPTLTAFFLTGFFFFGFTRFTLLERSGSYVRGQRTPLLIECVVLVGRESGLRGLILYGSSLDNFSLDNAAL